MFSFQGASEFLISKRLNEVLSFSKVLQSISLTFHSFLKWWAKMDSLSCRKATPVETVHRTVPKSRLSSPQRFLVVQPFWSLRPDLWNWWAKMDSNHRPHDYQSCALASWAIGPYLVDTSSISLASATSCPKLTHCAASPLQIKPFGFDSVPQHFFLVEISGIEPLTSCLQGRRSPSWAKPPYLLHLFVKYIALCTL